MAPTRRPGTAVQMLLLGLVAAVATLAARAFYPEPLPLDYAWGDHVAAAAEATGMRTVTTEEARVIADTFSHVVLDARKAADYAAGRIPGAMSLPVSAFDAHFGEISALLTPGQPILVYCSGAECEESLELGKILISAGFTNIALFAGGISAWEQAGYPVER